MSEPTTKISLPEKCDFLLEEHHRYKILYGGRGGAKSHSIAKALLVAGIRKRERILCTRELQASIKDSVHKLLSDQIELLGLNSFYGVTQSEITGVNGTNFIFAGLKHNISSIKSKEGITTCWVEEAECVSEDSWSVLIPTIRADDSEIWASFNPDQETDPTYQRFVTNPPPDSKVIEINWQDNPFFPEALRKEKDHLYRVDPDAASHVWGGKTRKHSKAQVLFGKWILDTFEPQQGWDGPYYGADWGFASDPVAIVRCWIYQHKLYIDHEAYGVGVETDDLPEFFSHMPGAADHVIRADNARPENISHMQRHGYPKVTACDKWPGSVEDGVSHLRSYEQIVIHPRCKHMADEARLWSYKVDRLTKDVLPELVDKHNHLSDSLRYALGPLIRGTALAGPSEESLHD